MGGLLPCIGGTQHTVGKAQDECARVVPITARFDSHHGQQPQYLPAQLKAGGARLRLYAFHSDIATRACETCLHVRLF